MIVKLNSRSWHGMYYNWVKGHYPTYDFKSICPYFWTIVSLIVCFPLILIWKIFKFTLRKVVLNPMERAIEKSFDKALREPSSPRKVPSKASKWWDKNSSTIGKWVERIWIGILIAMVLFVIVMSIIDLFKHKGTWMAFVYIFAFIGVIVTVLLAGFGVGEFIQSDTWSMIKGMLYSAKNKVCPMISWNGSKVVEEKEDLYYDEY